MERLNLFEEEIKKYLVINPVIDITNISSIAKWNLEHPDKPIGLNTKKGAIFLFLTALLYNYGGGGKGRNTQLLKLYPIIYQDDFNNSVEFHRLNPVLKDQILAVKHFLDSKADIANENILQNWWSLEKGKVGNSLDVTAINILTEIQNIKFNSGRKRKDNSIVLQHAFTSKAFLIARELHANKIWEDFPLKYCYIPDIKMVQKLIKKKFKSDWFHLFLISEFLHNELYSDQALILYDWPLLK